MSRILARKQWSDLTIFYSQIATFNYPTALTAAN